MIVVCDTFNPCDFLSCHFNTIAFFVKLWCFKPCLFSSYFQYKQDSQFQGWGGLTPCGHPQSHPNPILSMRWLNFNYKNNLKFEKKLKKNLDYQIFL